MAPVFKRQSAKAKAKVWLVAIICQLTLCFGAQANQSNRTRFLFTDLAKQFGRADYPVDSKYPEQIAQYHAPIVMQKTGHRPQYDAITRFDFDGDWIANNNWENAEFFAAPAYVYFSVIETHTHYFVSYAFFHARDYSRNCIPWVCHENDLEGIQLVIRKVGEWGVVEVLQTLAHDQIYNDVRPQLHILPGELAGHTGRVAIYIEPGGHGIKQWVGPLQGEVGGHLRKLSDLEVLKDQLSSYLRYYPEGVAEDPNQAKNGSFSYALLSTEDELWSRRDELGKGSMYQKHFDYKGVRLSIKGLPNAFAGEEYGKGRAKPPWAWHDSADTAVQKGDWFLDPAYMTLQRVSMPAPYSLKYIRHNFIDSLE
ncbi:MAG: hypothetical protein COT74_12845 [Bdellovibrionales bacterium CG10_big_fil_rev_8_21_14_0_10_45_34]|nr:MAG: hypothetical protein COT74_12845 [Bdellovibrionales bacterium CG10_big_fil_rev_8_21_14_0_10_45_34]